MHVVSNSRRPVPLEHVLYTGPAPGLEDDYGKQRRTFTVLDHNGIFSNEWYVATDRSATEIGGLFVLCRLISDAVER